MFLNRAPDRRNNIVGKKVAAYRKEMQISQRALADKLQCEVGFEIDKNGVQRIESGQRFVTDIEILKLAELFKVPLQELFND